MSPWRQFPAKDRPGKYAWLGPISLCLGLLSWALPGGGLFIALGSVGCGIASMVTATEYRIDWTAVVGTCAGSAQALFSLALFGMAWSGY